MNNNQKEILLNKLIISIDKKDLKSMKDILEKNFVNENEVIKKESHLLFPENFKVDVEFEKAKASLLIEFGADINILDKYDNTNILFLTQDIELLNFYIEKGADIHHISSWNKNNLLFNPLNTLEKFNFLIDSGVKVDHRNHLGDCFLNNLLREDLLEPLIKKIDFSLFKNEVFQNGNLLTECNDLQNLQVLIDNGCDINMNIYNNDDEKYSTALISAVFNKNAEKVDLFLKNGAYPNLYKQNGERFNLIGVERMDLAFINLDIIENLIDNGLNIKEEEFYQKVYLQPSNPVREFKEFKEICNLYAERIAKEESIIIKESISSVQDNDKKLKNKKRM